MRRGNPAGTCSRRSRSRRRFAATPRGAARNSPTGDRGRRGSAPRRARRPAGRSIALRGSEASPLPPERPAPCATRRPRRGPLPARRTAQALRADRAGRRRPRPPAGVRWPTARRGEWPRPGPAGSPTPPDRRLAPPAPLPPLRPASRCRASTRAAPARKPRARQGRGRSRRLRSRRPRGSPHAPAAPAQARSALLAWPNGRRKRRF